MKVATINGEVLHQCLLLEVTLKFLVQIQEKQQPKKSIHLSPLHRTNMDICKIMERCNQSKRKINSSSRRETTGHTIFKHYLASVDIKRWLKPRVPLLLFAKTPKLLIRQHLITLNRNYSSNRSLIPRRILLLSRHRRKILNENVLFDSKAHLHSKKFIVWNHRTQ